MQMDKAEDDMKIHDVAISGFEKSIEGSVGQIATLTHEIACARKRIEIFQTKAHIGHPWTELADAICAGVTSGRFSPTSSLPSLCAFVDAPNRNLEWSAPHISGELYAPQYPPIVEGKFIVTCP